MLCACVFILSRIVYVQTTNTNRTTRTQNNETKYCNYNTNGSTFFVQQNAGPYRVTKYCAIVAGALAVTAMTHFRMVLLIFQHVRVLRAA